MRLKTPYWQRVGAIAIGLAVALAAFLIHTKLRSRPAATVVTAFELDGDATKTPSPPLVRAMGPAAPALDLPAADIPALAAVEQLLPLAQAGRADAMRELAKRLMGCSHAPTGTDDELRSTALKRFYVERGHEPASDTEVATVAWMVNGYAKQRDGCVGIAPDVLAQRMKWLEQAARAGDTQAQVLSVVDGLNDMGRDEILMQPDEVERRRGEAREDLQRLLASGDCEALDLLSAAYSGERSEVDWIFQPNPSLSAAYAAAARLNSAHHFPQLAQAGLLNADQIAAAERQGQAIYARYCQGQGGG